MPIEKLPKMTESEIEAVLNEQSLCRIAYQGEEYPYLSPFQYVYENATLYFHLTRYGKKTRLLQISSKVCVEVEAYTADLGRFAFVILRGTLEEVTNPQERLQALTAMATHGKQYLSTEFLLAHGIHPEKGWDTLTTDPNLTIYKLTSITEKMGLQSRTPWKNL